MKKVVPLARVTLPAEVKQLAHPSCLAPRDGFSRDPNVNTKRYLGQGNSGGGGGGRVVSGTRDHIYKWGFSRSFMITWTCIRPASVPTDDIFGRSCLLQRERSRSYWAHMCNDS